MPTNRWSTQILVPVVWDVKTKPETTEQTLIVCTDGEELFNEHFVNGKYQGQNELTMPFSFIVLGGSPCPRGKFYEVEYTEGEQYGLFNRALIQAVDPETDLPLIVGMLRHKGILKSEIFTRKAYLREDIDAVNICRCSIDKDDNDDPCCYGGIVRPRPEDTVSIHDKVLGKDPSFPEFADQAVCLWYYAADHCREEWIDGKRDQFDTKPIFVSGGTNVMDPAFAEMRKAELAELQEHIESAAEIAQDYGLEFLFCHETDEKNPDNGSPIVYLTRSCTPDFFSTLVKYIIAEISNEPHEQG